MNIVLCSREDESRALSHGLVLCTPKEAEEYLMHYRTEGSKNGQRLYQYKDGSLTPLGRIHYGVGKGERAKKKADKAEKKAEKQQAKLSKAEEKYDKALLRTNSFFGNKQKKIEKMNEAKQKMELEKAKADLLTKNAQKLSDKAEKAQAKEEEGKRRLEEQAQRDTEKAVDKFIKDWNAKVVGTSDKAEKSKESNVPRESYDAITNEYGKSKPEEKAKVVDRALRRLKTLGEEQDPKMEPREKVKEAEDLMLFLTDNFDKFPKSQKRTVGDEILKRTQYNSDNGFNKYAAADNARDFLFEQMDSKSGNWNVGEFRDGSRGKVAYDNLNNEYEKQNAREMEIEKEIDYKWMPYKGPKRNSIVSAIASDIRDTKRKSEEVRLRKALNSDSIYQALKENSRKAESDLCGAVLRDMGFSDTPENRSLIFQYVFMD